MHSSNQSARTPLITIRLLHLLFCLPFKNMNKPSSRVLPVLFLVQFLETVPWVSAVQLFQKHCSLNWILFLCMFYNFSYIALRCHGHHSVPLSLIKDKRHRMLQMFYLMLLAADILYRGRGGKKLSMRGKDIIHSFSQTIKDKKII